MLDRRDSRGYIQPNLLTSRECDCDSFLLELCKWNGDSAILLFLIKNK